MNMTFQDTSTKYDTSSSSPYSVQGADRPGRRPPWKTTFGWLRANYSSDTTCRQEVKLLMGTVGRRYKQWGFHWGNRAKKETTAQRGIALPARYPQCVTRCAHKQSTVAPFSSAACFNRPRATHNAAAGFSGLWEKKEKKERKYESEGNPEHTDVVLSS